MSPEDLAAVARESRPRLVRLAAKLAPHRVAEDVAQEALAAIARARDSVPRAQAGAFLTEAVRRQALAAWRGVREEPVEIPEQASDDPSPEDTLRSAQIGARVRQAIASMPASRRDVVVAVLAEGRTVPEVAEAEGIPESTVRARLRDGSEDLRGVLLRERASEKRRTGGFSSWAIVWAVVDWTAWARRKIVRVGLPVAFGASIAGGALLALPAPRLAPTADELPVRVVESDTVRWPSSTRAERGVERPEPKAPPRAHHDAGARFRAERWGH